jgi:hypothetical protein
MLQYRIEKTGISGSEALELLSHGYMVQLRDRESGMESGDGTLKKAGRNQEPSV